MTKYTDHRGYPYPSSAREAGNGGLHSELLARAVAADLDAVDAGWAAEMQRSTIIYARSGDLTALSSGTQYTVLYDTVEKQTTGLGLVANANGILRPAAGGEGWYHVIATSHSRAEGAITAAAQHRLQLAIYGSSYGRLILRERRYGGNFQAGALDLYNELEAMIHIGVGDEVRSEFYHTNTGSTARVVAAGTRLTATLVRGD